MTYLAYDLEHVCLLRSSMLDAVEELRTVKCNDPLAADATNEIALSRQHLEQQWLPLLERLINADPMAQPSIAGRPDLDDITQALLLAVAERDGWLLGEVSVDWSGALPIVPMTPEQATALGEVLQQGDLKELTDAPQERASLAAQLTTIAADPEASKAFTAAFDRWPDLVSSLGQRRQVTLDGHPGDAAQAEADSFDAVLGGVAAVLTGQYGQQKVADIAMSVDPYDGAALVSQANLDADTLAMVSVDVLRKVREGRDDIVRDQWPADHFGGPSTGDLLFTTILRTEGAPTAFVIAVADEPDLLFWSATEDWRPKLIAKIGTDPANISPEDAGAVLHGFAQFFDDLDLVALAPHRYIVSPVAYRSYLGDLAVPWLKEFASSTSEFHLDFDTRRADLAIIIWDQEARDTIFAALERDISATGGEGSDYRDERARAKAFTLLLELDKERTIKLAEGAMASWNLSWDVSKLFVHYALEYTAPEADGYVQQGLDLVKTETEANGWLNAPPPVENVAKLAELAQIRIKLGAATTAITAAYLAMNDHGELPAGVPPPPVPSPADVDPIGDYDRRYEEWKEKYLVAGSDQEQHLDSKYSLFISQADISERAPTG